MKPASTEPARFCQITADGLNRGCTCRSLNRERLRRQLEAEPSLAGLADEIARTRPHLFSATAVFISPEQLDRMAAIVAADPEMRKVLLAGIPRTARVTPETAETLWAERRKLFFKPTTGYGGKAAYRGDKVTQRVWTEILGSDYVAQIMVPPSERRVEADGAGTDLKLDVRAYVYHGTIQFVAARLYQGQTTNFRTPGGGFAPVFIVRGESG